MHLLWLLLLLCECNCNMAQTKFSDGPGNPFKNFQTWMKLNVTWDNACNRFVFVCLLWKQNRLFNPQQDKPIKPLFSAYVETRPKCVLWKQKRLSNSRQDINRFKPFFCGNTHIVFIKCELFVVVGDVLTTYC